MEDSPAFVSYCRADSEFALKLANDLKAAGANVWMDQLDIEPGMHWDRAVEKALTDSRHLLVVVSPVSNDSENVSDEVSFALDPLQKKRVIPVLFKDCVVPFRLARLQYVDVRADYDHGVHSLVKALMEPHPLAQPHYPATADSTPTSLPVDSPQLPETLAPATLNTPPSTPWPTPTFPPAPLSASTVSPVVGPLGTQATGGAAAAHPKPLVGPSLWQRMPLPAKIALWVVPLLLFFLYALGA